MAALTTTVAANSNAIATKADGSALTTAESAITAHTGQIGALITSLSGLGNSFYTKPLVDAMLSAKEAVIGDGDLTIARTAGLHVAITAKADGNALTTAESVISTHTEQIGARLNSLYGLGKTF